jgi:PmbA protein
LYTVTGTETTMTPLNYRNAQIELTDRSLDITRVVCKFSRVRAIEKQKYHGGAARAIVDGRLGYAGGTGRLDRERLVRQAVEAAQSGAPARLDFPIVSISRDQSDPQLATLSESELRQMAEAVLKIIGGGRPEVVIELEIRHIRETVELTNTSGGQIETARAWLEGEAWVERHVGGEVLVVLDTFATARRDDSHLEFARRTARRLRWARRPVEPQPGPQSLILSPNALASLLRPLLFQLNGTLAAQSVSRGKKRSAGFAHQIGQQIFDAGFSLHDDATLAGRPHSALVDHEGTPAQRTALIERGIVKGFYHNLQSAALADARSTGNGWRWMLEPPQPALTNVVIGRGEAKLADLLSGLDRGLLVDLVMSSDGASGLQGEFSRTVALAYRIDRGRIAGYARGFGIGGSLYSSLQAIEGLSRDGFWAGSIDAPYIQLGSVNVTV